MLNAGVASSGAIGVGYGPSVGGQRPRNNNFTIEGIDNNDKSTTGPLVTVPNDAVAEFTVLQNQFSPEFGHSSGGQFNQVVKSGTNEFHGSLYEYFENRNMNAADNLDSVQGNPLHPRYDYNRFGGTFGGPIKRNKLFFFANYEYNPVGSTASTYYFAPTQTGYNTLASIPGVSPTNLSIFQKYLGVAPTVSPANQLPNGTPVTVGSRAIDVGQISSSLPKYTNYESGVGALDYNISDRDALRGRFILNRNGEIDTFGFPSTFFAIEPVNTYIVTASEYHTFTPNLTNEFRLGYTRFYQDVPTGGPQEKFPGLDQFPNLVIYELQAGIGPDSSAPQFTIQNTYQLTDNMNWTRGNHTFKFGFDGWKSISPSSFTQRARGDYEWNNFSDYLLDITPDYLAERTLGNVNYYGDQFLLGFYGNDSWKMRPNLTLNLGLRYEYQTLPYSERLQSVNNAASVPGVLSSMNPLRRTQPLCRAWVSHIRLEPAEKPQSARDSASTTMYCSTIWAPSLCRRNLIRPSIAMARTNLDSCERRHCAEQSTRVPQRRRCARRYLRLYSEPEKAQVYSMEPRYSACLWGELHRRGALSGQPRH